MLAGLLWLFKGDCFFCGVLLLFLIPKPFFIDEVIIVSNLFKYSRFMKLLRGRRGLRSCRFS